jgi:hypothetical protein
VCLSSINYSQDRILRNSKLTVNDYLKINTRVIIEQSMMQLKGNMLNDSKLLEIEEKICRKYGFSANEYEEASLSWFLYAPASAAIKGMKMCQILLNNLNEVPKSEKEWEKFFARELKDEIPDNVKSEFILYGEDIKTVDCSKYDVDKNNIFQYYSMKTSESGEIEFNIRNNKALWFDITTSTNGDGVHYEYLKFTDGNGDDMLIGPKEERKIKIKFYLGPHDDKMGMDKFDNNYLIQTSWLWGSDRPLFLEDWSTVRYLNLLNTAIPGGFDHETYSIFNVILSLNTFIEAPEFDIPTILSDKITEAVSKNKSLEKLISKSNIDKYIVKYKLKRVMRSIGFFSEMKDMWETLTGEGLKLENIPTCLGLTLQIASDFYLAMPASIKNKINNRIGKVGLKITTEKITKVANAIGLLMELGGKVSVLFDEIVVPQFTCISINLEISK